MSTPSLFPVLYQACLNVDTFAICMWKGLGGFTFDELSGRLQNFGEKWRQGKAYFKFLKELLLQEKGYIYYLFLTIFFLQL